MFKNIFVLLFNLTGIFDLNSLQKLEKKYHSTFKISSHLYQIFYFILKDLILEI